MTPVVEAADRREEVLDAARGWLRAGVIGEETLKEIQSLYPDDRVSVGPVFRGLLFLFCCIAVISAYSFLAWFAFSHETQGILLLACGAACAFLTERQLNAGRRRRGGTEAATSFMAASFLFAGSMWILSKHFGARGEDGVKAIHFLIASISLCAMARWGYALYGGIAAAAFYFFLLRLPHARILWIVAPLILTYPLFRVSESGRFAPGLRNGAAAAMAGGLIALYAAVHIGSFDHFFLEGKLFMGRAAAANRIHSPWRWASIAATAIVPAVILAFGIARRRRIWLTIGAALATASLMTIRVYIHIAPLWIVLTVSGAALVSAVLFLRRKLDSSPNHECFGFTAQPPLNLNPRHAAAEMAAVAVAMTPTGPAAGPQSQTDIQRGGKFGGGGASGNF